MKTRILLLYFGLGLNLHAQTQTLNGATTPPAVVHSPIVEVSPYAVTQRGPHHRMWQQVVSQTNRMGQTIYRTNSFTQLGTAINRWDGSQWVDADDRIVITSTGASATNTQHPVTFAANVNTAGSIDMTLPDGRHLRSHVVGLAYFDEATSNSVMFSETKDSIGQLLPSSNQVVYADAFTDFQADVRYTHAKGKFEQDVILRTQPPSPAQYGLNLQTTRLQLWTEFLNPPEPALTSKPMSVWMPGGGIAGKRALEDMNLDFGTMQVGRGKAFSTDQAVDHIAAVRVAKRWVHTAGRTFLVEEIYLNSVAQELQKLPPTSPSGTNGSSGSGSQGASLHMKLPAPKLEAKIKRPLQLARKDATKLRGYVLDYNIIVSTLTDYTFQSDMTYYIGDDLDLYGTNVIEGGTVIKTGPVDGGTTFHDTFVAKTAPYRYAIWTATNDNSVGTALAPSGTVPTLMGSATFLSLPDGGSITNMRFSYAWNALSGDADDMEVSDCQFIDCDHPITINADTSTLGLHNLLFTMDDSLNISDNYCSCQPGALTIYSQSVNVIAENVTADLGSQNLIMYFTWLDDASLTTVNFTNSILITPNLGAQYWGELGGAVGVTPNTNTTFYASSLPSGVFQNVGAGGHYLADDSPCQNAGTTNISSGTLADLSQKTTYPPVTFADNYFTNSYTFFPQVQRDASPNPNLGYHYDPIDYAFGAVKVTNATLTVMAGTVIGAFTTNGVAYGMAICTGSQLLAQGTPTSMCRIVNYNTVQEQAITNWSTPSDGLVSSDVLGLSPPAVINCRFTDFSILAQDTSHLDGAADGNNMVPNFQDCQFHGGSIISYISLNLTNCLWERVNFFLAPGDGNSSNLRNCLFWRGSVFLGTRPGLSGLVQDNMFDLVGITDTGGYTYGYNGFCTNSSPNILSLTNSTDVFMSNFTYQTSWLGNYYQTNTSPLIDKGSTTANSLGLYQYTTQTNQTKEADSQVDIGYHYVAVDGSGNPIDTDGDGIPDFLEDANGNGVVDSGETDWTNPNDLGLTVIITRPSNNSVIP